MADWEAARRDDPLPEDGEVERGGVRDGEGGQEAAVSAMVLFPRVASGGGGFDVGRVRIS